MSDFVYTIVLALLLVACAALFFAMVVSCMQAAGWTFCEGCERFLSPSEISRSQGPKLCESCCDKLWERILESLRQEELL